MDITIFPVSFPIDSETEKEIQAFLHTNKKLENMEYEQILNIPLLTDPMTKGFAILAYAEEDVVGVFVAIDRLGMHAYEWSGLVHVNYRGQGLGQALLQEMQRNLELRGSESELAVTMKESQSGVSFLQQAGYEWNFSNVTLKSIGSVKENNSEVDVVPLTNETHNLTNILMNAFGDTREEVQLILEDNKSTVFVAKQQGQVVGTVTLVEDGEALWITSLATDLERRGQGIGSALLAFSQSEALRRKCDAVMLDVEMDDVNGLSIYERADFQPIRQINYYVKHSTSN